MRDFIFVLIISVFMFEASAYADEHAKGDAQIVNEFAELHPKSITQKYFLEQFQQNMPNLRHSQHLLL
jgi:hypothetical protein